MKKIFLMALCSLINFNVMAKIVTKPVDYASNGTKLEGYVAYDDANKKPVPGILIVHDWMGLGDFTKEKAEKLAKEGYVAFAVDIYGKGLRPNDQTDAAKFAKKYKEDRELLRVRMNAALDALKSMKEVDSSQIIAIGYCFGGMAALELARSGAPIIGTASFHGTLSSSTPQDAKHIKGKVLVMHGADDPNVPPEEVRAFKKEMQDANVNLKFIAYPDAVHAFTNPQAGNDNKKGVAYNAKADKASWQELQNFFNEIFIGKQ